MEDAVNPALARAAYLAIVRRGEHDRFRVLRTTFHERPVDVIWDRRVDDRRRMTEAVPIDRRNTDRRQASPACWNGLGFLVARRRLERDSEE